MRLVGAKFGTDLIELMTNAQFSIIPSEWYENCPFSCIESFASGTPVIGANIGGIPEMGVQGETALLVEPASPLALAAAAERLLASPLQAAAMGRAGEKLARRRFDLEARAADLLAEYRHLASTRSRR